MPNPTPNLNALLQAAQQHHHAGRLPDAERLYRQILAQQPSHPDALNLLGVLASQTGHQDSAANLIREAIALRPNFPEAYCNLGNVLKQLGQLPQAIAAYRQSLALKPDMAGVLANLGFSLRENGQLHEAIAVCRRAIALKPDAPDAYHHLGVALKGIGQLNESLAALHQAIALRPNFGEAYNDLGITFSMLRRANEAVAAYRKSIALLPACADAHCNLGGVLQAVGQLDEAIAEYRRAIAINPNLPEVHSNLGNALKEHGLLDESIAAHRQAIALAPNRIHIHSNLIFALDYHPDFDSAAIAKELAHWNQQHAEPLRQFIRPHGNDRTPDRRLKIGYISPDFREHAVARFLLPLLTNHDRRQFEIFCYAQVPNPDEMTQKLRTHADHWQNIVGIPDDQLADQIRKDQIDILVDLALHSADNRLLLFARKPAPIQVTYLAYAGSSGLQTIDYRLSDPYLDPPGTDESVYSEKTFRLPKTYWCYQPIIAPPVNQLPATRINRITFGCLNNFSKVTEPTLQAWIAILRAVPDSRFLLHAHEGSHRQRVLNFLQQSGIDPDRLRFTGKAPLEEYLKLYNQIDIALDPFPYNGGTTTCDALHMGVPVITLKGTTAVGRAGYSILTNVGLPEFIAQTPTQYAEIARAFAEDRSRLSQLRATLRNQMQNSPLMNAPQFAKDIESAYRQMWTQWCRNTPT